MDSSDPPGRLIGVGRGADVFDIGGGRVLRRYRTNFDCAPEANVMRAAHAAGIPVPEVFDVDGVDLVMARVDGPSMLDAMVKQPWTLGTHAATLADLHKQVAATPIEGLELPGGDERGDAVLCHGDLHPENVMLAADGPVIIDWTNARRAAPHVDAALTWLLLVAAAVPGPLPVRAVAGMARRVFARRFVASYGSREIGEAAATALAIRSDDPGLTDVEKQRMAASVQARLTESV